MSELFTLKYKNMRKKKERIYISGPISGHDINERRKKFSMTAGYLEMVRDCEVVNPVAVADEHPEDETTHQHMRRDIELLMTCDLIYMMEGWTHSKGCMVELMVATSIGLPVLFEQIEEMVELD